MDPDTQLGRFLRHERSAIIERWTRAFSELPKARALSPAAILDHIPSLVDEIARQADDMGRGAPEAFPVDDAVAHAVRRFDVGFDLEEVTYEYSLLRKTLLALLEETAIALPARELQFLHAALDRAVSRAVSGFAHAQQRILRAIDRVSAGALTEASVDRMLANLLDVFVETTAPVDTVTLLLRDGDRLRVRASIGLDWDVRDWSVVIGEGFAGTIARERRAVAIRDVASDPLIRNERFRAAGLKALYGVPLLEGDQVVGVIHMGSRTAPAFSEEQEVLFRALASRATLVISHALTVARERAARITSHALAASGGLDQAGMRLLADIGRAFGWQTGIYWRQESGVLRCRGDWTQQGNSFSSFHEFSRGFEFTPGVGLPGRAWRSGGVEWIADLAEETQLPRKAIAVQQGLQSAIAFPLTTGDETLGVLEFFSSVPRVAVEEAVEMTAVITRHLPEFIQRIQAQEMLRQSEAQKSAMLQVALDCIVSMNASGRVTAWNPAATRTFGYSEHEAVGAQLAELIIPPELRSDHRAGLARYLATGREKYLNQRLEVPAVCNDGRRIFVELTITRVPVDGPPLFTGYLRDVTDRRRVEEEQARLYREAEEASRMRERLLAIVAHDLRSPVSAVMTGATMLLRRTQGTTDETTPRHAEAILRASLRMDRLIADLQDTANVHRGQLSVVRRPQRVAAILADALEVHQSTASEKHVALTLQDRVGDVEILADRDRIQQVLSNLIGNAIKFSRPGDAIRLRAYADGGNVVVEVADTGPGISPADLPLIFEPYWSGHREPHHDPSQSTGLGLFISRGIVEAHGGELTADSEPGRGSTFRFTLPIHL